MDTPAWLANLRPLERKQAERWLSQVGEATFMTIMEAATAATRPRHRPKADNASLIHRALVTYLTRPKLDKPAAASTAAAALMAEAPAGSRVSNMTLANLRRIMFDSLKDPLVGQLSDALKDVEARGLPIRLDTGWFPDPATVQQRFEATLRMMGMSAFIPAQDASNPQASASDTLSQAVVARLQNAGSPISEQEADRIQRIGHLLRALRGLINEDVPITRVTRLFDDMVAILNEASD